MIYFLHHIETGCIKIGYTSKTAEFRAQQIAQQVGRIYLLATMEGGEWEEGEQHGRFHEFRLFTPPKPLKGWEWFSPGSELLAFIETIKLPKPKLFDSTSNNRAAKYRSRNRRVDIKETMYELLKRVSPNRSPDKSIEGILDEWAATLYSDLYDEIKAELAEKHRPFRLVSVQGWAGSDSGEIEFLDERY